MGIKLHNPAEMNRSRMHETDNSNLLEFYKLKKVNREVEERDLKI